MKAVTGKRMTKLAEQKGLELARISGSHHICVKEGRSERLLFQFMGIEY